MCDFSPKAECVPAFAHEGKRGPFVSEVENRDEKWFEMEHVAVTFWRYLRERYWTKSRTLQEGFSGGEGRSILAQDKERWSQSDPSRPQSPAVRGFPGFGNRSLRCTLRGVFAVVGEHEGHQTPATADFSRWTFRSQAAKLPFSITQKSDFQVRSIFGTDCAYFAPL